MSRSTFFRVLFERETFSVGTNRYRHACISVCVTEADDLYSFNGDDEDDNVNYIASPIVKLIR